MSFINFYAFLSPMMKHCDSSNLFQSLCDMSCCVAVWFAGNKDMSYKKNATAYIILHVSFIQFSNPHGEII
jgi:hypothetical protein